ncbi:MAG: radical SAM protein [Candidatus Caenarcaniphilales bacterium]|nr:radical SAM protein [Candidatus Caenarcaniphilales bacterium]
MQKTLANFSDWLEQKDIFEYWDGQVMHPNYSRSLKERYKQHLEHNILYPQAVTMFLTNRCNLFCDHCGQSSGKALSNEMTLDEIFSVIEELKDLNVKYVSLSGGEPFLREDIFEIIDRLKEYGFIVGVISNGLITDSKLLDKLKTSAIDSLSLSIDGLEVTHNKIRGSSNSFASVVDFLKFIVNETDIPMSSVVTCVSPNSLRELESLRDLIFSIGVKSWVLRPIAPTGRAALHDELTLSDDELKQFINFCKANVLNGVDLTLSNDVCYLGEYDSLLRMSPYFPGLGWDSFQICANGDIKALSEDFVPIEANIRDRNLKDIWFNEFKLYREYEPSKLCLGCKYYGRCGGEFIPNSFIDQSCLVARGIVN